MFLAFFLAALVGAPLPADGEPVRPSPSATKLASSDLVVKRVLALEHPLRHGDYAWDDADVPSGPLVVTADLQAETLSVFRAGYEIGTAALLYGAPDHPTPLGEFRVRQKRARHVSNLYHASMPYMLRLTADGVAIHGSNVAWGYASHGCIGVPIPFARLLFEQVKPGDRVFITRGRFVEVGDVLVAGE